MNKKYIDFVPAKKTTKGTVASSASNAAKKATTSTKPATTVKKTVTPAKKVARPSAHRVVIPERRAKAPVRKTQRTVYRAMPERKSGTNDEALGVITSVDSVEKPVGNSGKRSVPVAEKKPVQKKDYQIPKSPFINQEKVKKRPLSKNVYQKEIKATDETAKGPVTIITKPEKDSKAGVVIVIIITIILGAVAGTVAFLLLPK